MWNHFYSVIVPQEKLVHGEYTGIFKENGDIVVCGEFILESINKIIPFDKLCVYREYNILFYICLLCIYTQLGIWPL